MTAVATRFHFADGRMAVERVQDCTPMVETCQTLQRETEQRGDVRLAARIPDVIVERYCNDAGITFAEWVGNPEHIKRVLNDPALAAFRVWPGRV